MRNSSRLGYLILLLVIFTISEGCVSPYYSTKYSAKNMQKFSVPKRSGVQRHFIKKGKPKLNPSYTKNARDYYGK